MNYLATIYPHQETINAWMELFNEAKSQSARTRRINKAITDTRTYLNDVREAVNRPGTSRGWLHGFIFTYAHVRSLERELMFLMEVKNQQHAKSILPNE